MNKFNICKLGKAVTLDFPNMFTPTYCTTMKIASRTRANTTPRGVKSEMDEL